MAVHLQRFPLIYTPGRRMSFHDGYFDLRHGSPHQAIDINAPEGTSVVSATDGQVAVRWVTQRDRRERTGCGWSDEGGNIVMIVDRFGYAHYYAHMLNLPLVSAGSYVSAGDAVGMVSNSGSIAHGSEPHLHYQVFPVGSGRDEEVCSGIFTRPLARAINTHPELVRVAVAIGGTVMRNGGVVFE